MVLEDQEEADIRRREVEVEAARGRVMELAAQQHQEFQDYRQRLEEQVFNGCVFCTLNRTEDRAHPGTKCKKAFEMGDEVVRAYQLALRMERFLRQDRVADKFGCCLGCFVPQELCNTWEEHIDGGWKKKANSDCQYEGWMVSAFAWTWIQVPEDCIQL